MDLLTKLTKELIQYRNEMKKSHDQSQEGNKISQESSQLIEKANERLLNIDIIISKFSLFKENWNNIFNQNMEEHMLIMGK